MLDKLSQREKILLIVAVTLIIAAVYYFYIYKPLVVNVQKLEEKKINLENQVETGRMYVSKVPDLRKEYARLQEARREKAQKFIDLSILELLIDVREYARENNVILSRFSPAETNKNISMNIGIDGDYEQLCWFFLDMMNWRGPFEFRELNMKGQDENLSASLNVLFLKYNGSNGGGQ